MHAHLLVTAHVVLCAYQWFAPGCGGGGVGGGGGAATYRKFDFFRFFNVNFPTLALYYESNFRPWGELMIGTYNT